MDKGSSHPHRRKWLKVILWIFAVIISLPIFIVLLFQLGPVQNFAKTKIEDYLRNKFHTSVIIGQMRLTWWNSLSIKKLYLRDTRNKPLLSSGSLEASFNLLDLLSNKLTIKAVDWDNVLVNVYRLPGDTTYNYQFIIDAFASGTKADTATAGEPMIFSVGNVSITNCRLRYIDAPAGMETTVSWKSLSLDPKEIKPETSLYDIDKLQLDGLRGIIALKYIAQTPIAREVKEEVREADTAASPFMIKASLLALKDCNVWFDDDASGMNTNFQVGDLGITNALFDPSKSTIAAEDIRVHTTRGAFATRKGKETLTTVVAADSTVKTAWIFNVKNIDFDSLGFRYNKEDIAPANSGLDPNHLVLDNIRLQAKDLAYYTDSIMVNLNELKLQEKSGFAIREGHATLLYTDKIIALRNLLLRTNKSRIASELVAEAPSFKTVADNMKELQIKAVLENTYVDMNEIGQLLPDLKKNPSIKPLLRKFITAEGNISGSMARLNVNKILITDRDGTRLFVTGIIQNAADPNRLIATLQEIDIRSGEASIKSWVPAGTIPDSISIPSWLHLQGAATYSINELFTNLRLTSALGDITITGNASRYMDAKNSRYNVKVPLLRMDLGRLLQDTSLGKINATLSAKGTGYDYKTLTADINLVIKEAYYNKYRFHDISSIASLNKGAYNLFLQSKDTNALATVQLEGLLDSLKSAVAGTIDLQKIDLYATRLSATPMAAKGNVLLDIKSFKPRHLDGSIVLSGIQFANDSTIIALDTVRMLASDTVNQQQLTLTGPFGFITANGAYDYTKAFTDLSSMVQQHLRPADSSKRFVAKTSEIMDLNASLTMPASLQSFASGLVMDQPLIITGRLNTDSSLLSVNFGVQKTKYNDFVIDTLKGSVNSDSSKLISNIYLSRLIHPQFPLEKTTIDVLASKGRIDTDINLLDREERRKYALGAYIDFLPADALSFSLKPELILNKTPWAVSDSNRIVMAGGTLKSADLAISSSGQSLSVKTGSSKSSASSSLEINLDKFRLSTLTAFLEKDSLLAEGVATGKATITDYDKSPLIDARLNIDSIKLMNTSLGTLNIAANTPVAEEYNINAKLTGNDNDVSVEGKYAKELDFSVNLNKLNMASIEPLTMGGANRMKGVTTGQFTIKGTADNPRIQGALNFDSVAANITAIGTYIKMNKEQMVFDERGINFNQFAISDSLNNKMMVNGRILTKDYKDYRFQLDVKADKFMAAGPKQSPDQLVYGPAFIDADAKIRGTMDVPRVDLKLILKDSSNFTLVVPESEPGIAEREGVMVFVDRNNQLDSSLLRLKAVSDSLQGKEGTKGMALTAQIEVTPSSTLRVIIDQQNGDYLEVKGKANLDASMTPSSDLSLTGRYEIDEGSYNMSLNNLIKRKFNIEKGSTITMQGDPMNALVNITARYRVEASAADLVADQLAGATDTKRNQFRQKLPIDVYLEIRNSLLKPEISFRLDMPERDRNALNGVVYNRIKQINEVESELNKQVMGLLVLNSFIPENPLALVNDRGGGGSGVEGTARKSASKLISQQLNNFAGDLFKGFDVNFDLQSEDDYSTGKLENSTNLNVGVSKSLFKDRVSVSVGSSVNIEGPQQTQQASTLIGDVSVDYKITADGRYRIRGYRQNETDAIVEGQIIETGASFIYVIDYDEFRELFHRKKQKPTKSSIKPAPTDTSTGKNGK